ncbi:hypothetical protein BUALT_Bualt09G0081000 [Buddleja alternifolia]|uniref:Protein PTST homolog 3, chloroplastic n=1 Tax=Buddleja alternifolia TaxID=168488 RepID=A0AAV6X878_9LAMI|nr:hypothetical protein BUALT_Bualt09G0081000 [Buddleja alternifolia]
MATLIHFPIFHSFSSHKLFFSSPLPSHIYDRQKCRYSTIFASSLKKSPRGSRKVKSNADLCNDIREFLSSVGLPQNHVPSTKELSHHGRIFEWTLEALRFRSRINLKKLPPIGKLVLQDLANIVRRRGYKFIRELLETSSEENFIRSNIDTGQTAKLEMFSSVGQNEEMKVLSDDILANEGVPEKDFHGFIETNAELKRKDESSFVSEPSTLSLQEKVTKFIRHGELDSVEDISFGITNDKLADEAGRNIEFEDARDLELASSDGQQKDLTTCISSDAETLNDNVPSSVQKVEDPVLENSISRNNYFSTEERTSIGHGNDFDIEKVENQGDITCLKFLLHQKELELTRLKQQIEKEKIALSMLQTKAETEISKVQKLISERETELHAAEESLSGLKEVEIQYSGDGETVELAGSFNGWHHKIKMDLQPSSSIVNPTESRTSRLWLAVLWLYPGVYEMDDCAYASMLKPRTIPLSSAESQGDNTAAIDIIKIQNSRLFSPCNCWKIQSSWKVVIS